MESRVTIQVPEKASYIIKTIMDAGCGDGHNAIKILEDYNHKGTVYAVDIYDASIEDMEKYKLENNVDNLINIEADITQGVEEINDESLDVILMVNVFHGFKASRKIDEAIDELKRHGVDENNIDFYFVISGMTSLK